MRNQTSELSIGFASNLVPLILSGEKTYTYRLGNKYELLKVGSKIKTHDSSTKQDFAILEITEKYWTTFKDLSINKPGNEVYKSKDEQKQTFKTYYNKDLANDDKILVLGFKVIKAL